MAKHVAYVIAETEKEARETYRRWVNGNVGDRRIMEAWDLCFKGQADARYRLAEHRKTAQRGKDPKLWAIELGVTHIDLAPSDTGVPPYKGGDIITVNDKEYGIRYRATVGEVLLAGASRPWIVHFESVNPIEPRESRHYVGSLEADDDGTSPNIEQDN